MAKININAGQLLMLHAQREQMRGTFIELINQGKIQQFYRDNGMRIQTLIAKNEAIIAEFMELDENGRVKFTEGKLPIYKDGKLEADYKVAINALHDTVIPIEI